MKEKLRKTENKMQNQVVHQHLLQIRRKASHRKIEIGWLHCEGGKMKQIRARQGGGTRMVPIGVECGMNEVLQRGKKLFFPDGMSSKGHESGFNFELRDYKQNPVQKDLTVGFIYDTLCMARLRFYIATTAKVIAIEDEDEEVTFGPGSPGGDIDGDDDDTEPFEFVFELQPSPGSSSSFLVMDAPPDELLSTVSHDASSAQPSPVSHDASSAQPSPVSHDAQPPATTSQASATRIIEIHHGNCLNELIKEFMDPAVLTQQFFFRRILPDNSVEKGIGEGVVRDVYCAFWEEFYDRCTVGTL